MLNCRVCKKSMSFVYDVHERETVFVLWECACGIKELERKPASQHPRPAASVSAITAAVPAEASS